MKTSTYYFLFCFLAFGISGFGQSEKKSVVIGSMISRPNAILILNPPDGNQGFLLPQVSTANRLAIQPTSPLEDGLVVYDITEKSFYFWKDNQWMKGLGGNLSQSITFDPATNKLSLSNGNTVDLTSLNEIPDQLGQAGKFITTDGTNLSWTTLSTLGDITGVVAGNGLSGGVTSGEASLSVNTDNTTITVNGSNQLQVADASVSTSKILPGAASTFLTTNGTGQVEWITPSFNDSQDLFLSGNTLAISNGVSADLNNITASGQVSGAINNLVINSGAVTSAHILDETIQNSDLANLTITGAKINDGTITSAKLNNSGVVSGGYGSSTQVAQFQVDAQGRITNAANVTITGVAPTGAAGGDLTGNFPNPAINSNAITTSKINDDAVTTTKIQDGTIATSDLANDAVTTTKIASGGISKVLSTNATGNVVWLDPIIDTNTDEQDLSLAGNTLNIQNGLAADLNTLQTGGEVSGPLNNIIIDADAITTPKILDAAVTNSKIAAGIGVAKLQAGADGQVLSSSAGTPVWITPPSGGSVTEIIAGTGLDGGTINTAGTISLADNGITTAKILNETILSEDIANLTIATGDIANNAITTFKIAPGANNTVLATDATGNVNWLSAAVDTDIQQLTLSGNTLSLTNDITPIDLVALGEVSGDLDNLTIGAGVIDAGNMIAGNYNSVITIGSYGINITGNAVSATSSTSFSGNLTGDVTGTQVATLIAGDAVTTAKILNATILNEDIHLAAAIAGSKINPNFASQNVSTTGTLSVGGTTTLSTLASATTTMVVASPSGALSTQALPAALTTYNLTTSTPGVVVSSGTGVLVGNDVSITIQNATSSQPGLLTGGDYATFSAKIDPTDAPAVGDIGGNFASGLVINNNAVSTVEIANDAVTSAKLQDDATVDANRAVTTNHLRDGAVVSAKILDGEVNTVDLNDGAVTNVKITDVAPSKITAAGAVTGNVLKFNGTNWVPLPDASGAGTVTSIATSGGLTGGTITGTGTVSIADAGVTTLKIADSNITSAKIADGAVTNLKLANTTVSAGSYGSGTQIPQIDIDAQGRITFAGNVAITGAAPTGNANGDLNGTFPNPTVDGIQGRPVALTAPGNGQVLTWDGLVWAPKTPLVDGLTLIGTGIPANEFRIKPGAANQVLITDPALNVQWVNQSALNTNLTAAGEVSGALTSLVITNDAVTSAKILDGAITGTDILNATITNADINTAAAITVDKLAAGTNTYVLTSVAGTPTWTAPLSTVAGGDLSGNYPNPNINPTAGDNIISAINNIATTATINVNRLPSISGDVTGTLNTTTVAKLQGVDVSTTNPTDLQVLQYDGSTTQWKPVTVPGIISSAAFKAQQTIAQSIPGNTITMVTWNNELYDDTGNFTSNTFTAPSVGLYHFDVIVSVQNMDKDDYTEVTLRVGGLDIQKAIGNTGGKNSDISVSISTDVKLNLGDPVRVFVYIPNSLSTMGQGVRTQFSGRKIY